MIIAIHFVILCASQLDRTIMEKSSIQAIELIKEVIHADEKVSQEDVALGIIYILCDYHVQITALVA
jgi:hypothetical protein